MRKVKSTLRIFSPPSYILGCCFFLFLSSSFFLSNFFHFRGKSLSRNVCLRCRERTPAIFLIDNCFSYNLCARNVSTFPFCVFVFFSVFVSFLLLFGLGSKTTRENGNKKLNNPVDNISQ